jgi:hypothetical protein
MMNIISVRVCKVIGIDASKKNVQEKRNLFIKDFMILPLINEESYLLRARWGEGD